MGLLQAVEMERKLAGAEAKEEGEVLAKLEEQLDELHSKRAKELAAAEEEAAGATRTLQEEAESKALGQEVALLQSAVEELTAAC